MRAKTIYQTPVKERWWFKYLVAIGALMVIATLFAWMRGAFSETHPRFVLQKLSDAFFMTGFVTFFQILRAAVVRGGFLDKVAELLGRFFQLFRQDKVDRKYRNFGNYRKVTRDREPSYRFLLILGVLFMAIGGALLVAYFAVQ